MRVNRSFVSGLLVLGVALGALLALSGCKPASDASSSAGGASSATNGGDTIHIGQYASMTGTTATFGQDTDAGVRLAIDEINAKGGILGKKIELKTLDDQSKPEEAKTVATTLAADPSIVAVIGEVASGRSIAAAPVFEHAGIPMISPSSTNVKVTEKGPHIFRVCFIDPFQGFVMAKFAHDNLKLTKVAILRDKKNEYSVGLADVFTTEFTKMGGTIVADNSYQEGDSDFRAQLSQLKDAKPQAIYVPGYYTQEARGLGLNVPLLGGDGWDSPALVQGAGGPGGALEGSYFSNHYSVNDTSPAVQKFVTDYKKANGDKVPSGNAALGYDAMMLLADAITRAGSTDREAITKAIASTKDFPGVTGTITIDEKRNARKSATVLQIKGSEYSFAGRVDPPSSDGTAPAASASASPAASGSPTASASPAASATP